MLLLLLLEASEQNAQIDNNEKNENEIRMKYYINIRYILLDMKFNNKGFICASDDSLLAIHNPLPSLLSCDQLFTLSCVLFPAVKLH